MPSDEHWAPGTSLHVLALQQGSLHSWTHTQTGSRLQEWRAQTNLDLFYSHSKPVFISFLCKANETWGTFLKQFFQVLFVSFFWFLLHFPIHPDILDRSVGPVSQLVACWWQYCSKSCPMYHQPKTIIIQYILFHKGKQVIQICKNMKARKRVNVPFRRTINNEVVT